MSDGKPTESRCTAKIRPMRPLSQMEVECELGEPHPGDHQGVIRDYAYGGSYTRLMWADSDRRCFRGVFVPCGDNDAPCLLPSGHFGNHEMMV